MNMTIAAFVALLPALAAAAPSLESAASGSLAAFEAAPLPRPTAAAAALARRPAVATIKGGMSGFPVDLTFDRGAWTITGGIGGYPADIHIDQDGKKVSGGVNGSPIELTFDWTPEKVTYKGAANLSPVEYMVDWQAGTVDGYANNARLHLEFDLAKGTVNPDKSYANAAPVGLALDAQSGKLTGAMNHSAVEMTIVNGDLSDFLQYLFVFLKR
jgi:hypothetical protein